MRTLFSLLLVVLLSGSARADWYYVNAVADTGSQTVPEGIRWSMLHFRTVVWESYTSGPNDSWDYNDGYLGRVPYVTYTTHYLPSNPSGRWSAWLFSGSQRIRDFYTNRYYRVSWPATSAFNIPAIDPNSWPWPIPNTVVLPIRFTIVPD